MINSSENQRRLLIISGLSGAGKSLVLNTLEDLNYYCIDNLPGSLFDQLSKLLIDPENDFPMRVGVGIDARSPEKDLLALPKSISALKDNGVNTEVVYLEASINVLTTRFSETRRKHPLSTDDVTLTDAIDKERNILGALSDIADLHIDTSHTTVHQLRDHVRERIVNRPLASVSMQFISFGYKNGIPRDADFVFDVRCLPNPHWENRLRKHSGKDKEVIDFLSQKPTVITMLSQIKEFLLQWVPLFEAENRSYLCIAIGCTGGHHRSVYFAEQLADYFRTAGKHIVVRHRDL